MSAQSSTPIVLVHGLFGFDQLTLSGADYFRRIPQALRDNGYVVPPAPRLATAGSIATRAEKLKAYLNDPTISEVFNRKVHIIAHSMGGLDTRYMISNLGMHERVRSLTTISTPHLGSPIADMVVAGGHAVLAKFLAHLGADVYGVADLTTEASRRFNEAVEDVSNVRYAYIAGRFTPPKVLGAPVGVLGLTQRIIEERDGANDGLVSVRSATFGGERTGWRDLGVWEGNHFRIINWGANLVPTPAELVDETFVEKYGALAATLNVMEQ